MGFQTARAKKNRSNNSDDIAPDPLHTVNTLSIVIHCFKAMFTCTKDREACLITFIYLWLTQSLENIKSADDIPSLTRVTGSETCDAHRLRIIHVDGKSWVEYAQCYSTPQGVFWQWQPLPIILNNFFYHYVQTLSTTAVTPLLSAQQRQQLWILISKPWKTPKEYAQYGRLRKDVFFRYFTIMAQRCPYLSTTAKSIVLPEHVLHHFSAKAYQKENSNQIRYKIFRAHNQYLERLDTASKQYGINLSINNAHHKIALLFDANLTLPSYLNKKGQIDAFERRKNANNQGYQYIQLPSIEIGSRRALPLDQLRLFFDAIDEHVKGCIPLQDWTINQLITTTYQLAFQFLILTGVRPTHALSLEKCRCYGIKQAIHSDKGRYRVIYLCNYLQESIHYYLSIQKGLLTQLNIKTTSPYLWFLLDKDNQAQVLNAKIMRQFMQQHWPHRYLLNAIKKQPYSKWKALLREQFSTPPAWHHDNIVPTILYFFTYDLIQYGGVKAATLSVSSLSKYTNIYTILSNHPLTYIQACDHDGLMQWATTLYESIDSEGDRWLIYNFLRFLPQLSVTEHFDITQFSSPFFL